MDGMSAVDVYDFQVEPLKEMGLSSSYFEPFLASWDMDPGSVVMLFKYVNEFNSLGTLE